LYFLPDVTVTDYTINIRFFDEEKPDLIPNFTMTTTSNVNFYQLFRKYKLGEILMMI
jgi:hypothetical protein